MNCETQSLDPQPQWIGKVLAPAIQFWLRSQADQVEALQVEISGRNRQLLTGYLPKVSLFAQRAVYQGLHLSEIELTAENIRINLGQVLKGKPLCLLEPVRVTGSVHLEQSDLQASLDAPLLIQALQDLLLSWGSMVAVSSDSSLPIQWQKAEITPDHIKIQGEFQQPEQPTQQVLMQTGLSILSGQILHLTPLRVQGGLLQDFPSEFQIPLGSEVHLKTVSLNPGKLAVQGEILVTP